jgi:glycosyltransferase involved in cell wall biosynthesis
MKIVFNTKSSLKHNLQDYKYFLHESLKRITLKHPQHEFIIIADHADANRFSFDKNVTVVITHQLSHYPLLRKLWFDLKLPVILKKYNADIFVSCDGFCSLTTRLPQCLLLHDLTFFYNPSVIKRSHLFLYNRFLPEFLHKATTIVTVSASFKNDLSVQYKIPDDKIDVINTAAKEIYLPVDEKEKEETKRKYCNEKNYYIYTGVIHSHKSLFNLLKAFSVFKKRQKSNWKLVLTGSRDRESKSFNESLKTYKYRDDIVLTGFVKDEDMVKLTGSAYAMIHPTQWDSVGIAALEAMNCHIPVIASPDPFIKEIAGDAALYTNSDDHTDMAEKMMQLYKDEALRNGLVEKGKIVAAKYSWDKTADLLWQSIQKAYAAPGKTQK